MNVINNKLTKQTKSNMKKRFTFLIAALGLLMTILVTPKGVWGQVTSATPENGKSYVIAVYNSSKYYALPNGAVNGGTINGSEISLNAINKVNTSDANGITWTLEEGTGQNSGQYYVKYTNDNDTYYLYKNGTGATNYNFAVNKTSKNYWYFTSNSKGGYDVTAIGRGTNNIHIQYNDKFRCYSSCTSVILLEIGDVAAYEITALVNDHDMGSVELNGTTITATPNDGYRVSTTTPYELTSGTATVTNNGDNTFTVTPSSNCTVTINFEAILPHTLSSAVTPDGAGTVSLGATSVNEGANTTATAAANAGYKFSEWSITGTGASLSSTTDNPTTVTMGTTDATVTATFALAYTITCATGLVNGYITADMATAIEGETVTITASPQLGFMLSTITVTEVDENDIIIDNNVALFEMPNCNVTVSATFQAVDTYVLYTGDLTEGDYVIYYDGKAMKNTVISDRLQYMETTPAENKITDPDPSIVWHIAQSGNYWTIYNASVSEYAASTGKANKAQLLSSGTDNKSLWTVSGTEEYEFVNKYNSSNNVNANLRNNGTYGFACYSTSTGGALSLYKKSVSSTMTVASPDNGTITATPAGASAIAEGGSTTVLSETVVSLSANGEGDYVLDEWDVYKTGESASKVAVTNNQFVMPDYNVTVGASFRLPTKFTVQYSINGNIDDNLTQSNISEGDQITLPTTSAVTPPSGYTFVGWSESETSETVISGESYTPTDNVTLYLVFIKSGESVGYNKVTTLDAITPGKYIIVNDNYCLPSATTGASAAPAKSSNYQVEKASTTSNYTTVPDNTEWIFTGNNTATMTIKNSVGSYLYATNDNNGIRIYTTPDTWAFEINSSGFAMKDANNNRYCATYSSGDNWRSYISPTHENYGKGGVLYLYKKAQVYTRVYNTITTEMANIPATSIVTVPNGVALTLTGSNNGNASNLIIEDGGQLICSNSVAATVQKSVTGATSWTGSDNSGWMAISSPVGDINPTTVANMTPSAVEDVPQFDLYKYEESFGWRNYNNAIYNLTNGYGYLYARNGDATLNFIGTVTSSNVQLTGLTNTDAVKHSGLHLIGNPYTHNIYKGVAITGDLVDGYYALNESGSWIPTTDATAIKPMQAVFVFVSQNNATIDITNTAAEPSSKANHDYIRFTVANNQYEDVTYAMFDKGYGLNKIEHRNAEAPMIYIPRDDENYAIAMMDDDVNIFGLDFKANTMGKYTLSYKTQGVFSYLHVIDRLTGEDVDMILEGEYSFIGSPTDAENRFIVKLSYDANGLENGSDIFAYQNGTDIIVEGEGELQVFDLMGRHIMNANVNGTETISTSILNTGVYVMRLNGKVQKIVVR